jgi:hypothetical protein
MATSGSALGKRARRDSISSVSAQDQFHDTEDDNFHSSDNRTDIQLQHASKFAQIDISKPSLLNVPHSVCSLQPHLPLTFSSHEDYEIHYLQQHTNRCQECQRNFPYDHYLQLHITENHDSFAAVKRHRGEAIVWLWPISCLNITDHYI